MDSMTEQFPVLSANEVRDWIARHVPAGEFRVRTRMLIVPEATRTVPLPLLFDAVYQLLRSAVRQIDVLVALGTHPPMNERQICRLLGISDEERGALFATLELYNHEWDRPE